MSYLLPNGKQHFTDNNGKPLANGKVFHYFVGTNNPKGTFQDSGLTIPNTNPIILNARGEASIYGSGNYRQVLQSSSGAVIWDQVIVDSGGVAQQAVDDLRSDLEDSNDPNNGAAILGRGVVALNSVQDLQTAKRDSSLRYIAKGYYPGTTIGGGEFYWDASSVAADNSGTVISVSGVPTGRFIRIVRDTYIKTSEFGVDLTGSQSAATRLQSMIDLEIPIWLDSGTHKIDQTIFYKNTTMHGPGTISIACDSSFTVIPDSFMTADAAITAKAPIAAGPTYKVDMACKIVFTNSDPTKPHTPIRFVGLRDSKFNMDVTCTGAGTVTQTNLPDFYFDNRRVSIRGRYVVTQLVDTNAGGMWVRDVGLAGADSATRYSENVVVESETYISNNGQDEALSFFCPSGGSMRNCGVMAATVEGGGLGLGFLEFNASTRRQALFDCFAENTSVIVNSLRTSQPAVKWDKAFGRANGVTVHIRGFRDIATAGQFYAGFRNSTPRSNPEYPMLNGCRVLLETAVDPASEIRAFDGRLRLTDCEIAQDPGATAFEYGVKNGDTILGGRWPGASIATFETVSDVMDARPGSVTYSNVARRRGIGIYKTESVTPDGSGNVVVTHNFGVNPVFAEGSLENNNLRDVIVITKASATITYRIIDRATGAPVTSGTFTLIWKAEA